MVEGVSQVPVVAPQKRTIKKALIATGIASAVGVAAGCCSNNRTKDSTFFLEIVEKCANENSIRKYLADFLYKGKPIPEASKEVFENCVKETVEIRKEFFKAAKRSYKSAGVLIGIVAGLGTLAVLGLADYVVKLLASHKKEA
jgi:hypothetical protein